MNIFKRIQEIGIRCAWLKLKHTLFPSAEAKEICANSGAYEYLERYADVCDWNRADWKPVKGEKIIWTCWWQGEKNAPKLVKKCINQMRFYANSYEVHVITADNVSDFIQIPQYIIEKHEKGIIPHAHFSDIIRLMLLKEYGGVWIDSTIWMTDVLPDIIAQSELFLFHSSGRSSIVMINPFIVAIPHHPIIEDVLTLLLNYWKYENKLVAYTIMPLFCTMAIRKSKFNARLWEKMPLLYSKLLDLLLPILNKPFNILEYDMVKSCSMLHKLTYKFEQYGVDTSAKGTFYDVLINESKPCNGV